jgi:hypothetical protein
MDLTREAAFGGRVGMPDAICQIGLDGLLGVPPSGYLSTMLIRNPAPLPL